MSEQPSLPPSFSRTEIATIAAMLLGEIADACKYTEACEAAVSLLSIAEKVAKEPDPEIRDGSKIPWHLLGPDESQIMDPQSNIEATVKEQLVKVGFNVNTLDMEHNKKFLGRYSGENFCSQQNRQRKEHPDLSGGFFLSFRMTRRGIY